jgi:hypothetical protein
MPAPWEKYQAMTSAQSADVPPWVKYGGSDKPEMGWGEYIGRGVTDALPVAGGLLGGYVGNVPGAALGYAGGAEAKGLLNHYAFGDEVPSTNPVDQVERVAGNAAEGATQQLAVPVAGKAMGLLAQAPKAAATAAKAAASEKRNIMIKPILDELAAIRKSLPQTGGQDIDALMQEVKVLNKYGKVNLQELDAIKSRLGEVLDSEETGPNLRRAAVLAQDAAERVATPAKKYGPAPTSPFAKTIFPVKKK